MERSIPEIIATLAIVALGLLLLGFLGFAFIFGAADNTQVSFNATELSADGVVDDITYDPTAQQQSFIERTIRTGTGQQVRLYYVPFFEGAPAHQVHERSGDEFVYVEQEGTIYRVRVTAIKEIEAIRQTLELERVNETSGDVIQYEELPEVDKREVRSAHTIKYRRDCGNTSRVKTPPYCWAVYSKEDANRSILVPTSDAEYVRYQNQTFRLVPFVRSVDATAIEYRATPIANDSNEFRSRLVTSVSEGELTNEERELLQQAIHGGYHIKVHRNDFKQVPRERFNTLLPKLGLPSLDRLSQGHQGTSYGYILYRGTYYRIKIDYRDTYA